MTGRSNICLYKAASENNVELCRVLVEKGEDVDRPEPDCFYFWTDEDEYMSPLHGAIDNGAFEACEFLVKSAGASVECFFGGRSAIGRAVKKGDFRITNFLLDNGAHVAERFLLFPCVETENMRMIHLLCDRGADPSYALSYALERKKPHVFEFLLERTRKIQSDNDVLFYVQDLRTMKRLIEKGANVNCDHGEGYRRSLAVHLIQKYQGVDKNDLFHFLVEHTDIKDVSLIVTEECPFGILSQQEREEIASRDWLKRRPFFLGEKRTRSFM